MTKLELANKLAECLTKAVEDPERWKFDWIEHGVAQKLLAKWKEVCDE